LLWTTDHIISLWALLVQNIVVARNVHPRAAYYLAIIWLNWSFYIWTDRAWTTIYNCPAYRLLSMIQCYQEIRRQGKYLLWIFCAGLISLYSAGSWKTKSLSHPHESRETEIGICAHCLFFTRW
jgi:hypothetical protein